MLIKRTGIDEIFSVDVEDLFEVDQPFPTMLSGVYFAILDKTAVVYVGQSVQVPLRISTHLNESDWVQEVGGQSELTWAILPLPVALLDVVERYYIKKFFNTLVAGFGNVGNPKKNIPSSVRKSIVKPKLKPYPARMPQPTQPSKEKQPFQRFPKTLGICTVADIFDSFRKD